MFRIVRAGLAVLVGVVVGSTAGCGTSGGSAAVREETFHNASLQEVGDLYRSHLTDAGKPPTKAAEFAKYEMGLPTGYKELKSGNVVVFWGAPLSDSASDTVLAYEKTTPESGGYVLMQDGKTIERMTADQFKSAPKAPGKAQ
jgi:hypothetical protein